MARDLEVRHCRALVAVHDGGGVGAAARALGVAQSTVSETLLSLERLLGVPVTLRRAGREAMLTPAAEALLPHARSLIAASEAVMSAGARHGRASVRLGTVESISSFLLPDPLGAFRRQWPGIDVRITIGLCEDLRRRVERSELDAALTIEGANQGAPGLLSPVGLRLIVAPGHPLAGRIMTGDDLAARTLLLSDSEGSFNDLLRSWAARADGQAAFESAGSVEGVKRGVLNADAIGVLPDYAVAEDLAAGSLVALRFDQPLPAIALRLTTLAIPVTGSPLESLAARIRDALIPADD
ncbi:LysR family transcriptional regulator [Sphingomonas bacterium]|uniref:LysR family transcriptional regulator n=1 Tax=Sphingomonas bacterium TaxID=1895847 RepID=UPI002606CDAA|nr:LysR family transcriptional regulator [Sphingomonas bacterium]